MTASSMEVISSKSITLIYRMSCIQKQKSKYIQKLERKTQFERTTVAEVLAFTNTSKNFEGSMTFEKDKIKKVHNRINL